MILFICIFLALLLPAIVFMTRRGLKVVSSNKGLTLIIDSRKKLEIRNQDKASLQLGSPIFDSRPIYTLISRCPECKADRAHLLMNMTESVADRTCVDCGHEWKERILV